MACNTSEFFVFYLAAAYRFNQGIHGCIFVFFNYYAMIIAIRLFFNPDFAVGIVMKGKKAIKTSG